MIRFTYISNPLNPKRETQEFPFDRTRNIGDYLTDFSFKDKDQFKLDTFKVIVSGRKVTDLEETLKNGDEVIIAPDVELTVIGAALTAFGGGSLLWGIVKAVVYVAIIAYGIYSMVSKPRKPSNGAFGTRGVDESSPTYGWDGIATTQEVGAPVAVIYGEHRYGGNIVNQYVRYDGDTNYLNVLIGMGEGEIESISDIYINDNPSENFDGITVTTKMGTNAQTMIENFEDAHNIYSVGAELPQNDPHVYTTIDSDVEAFEVHLKFTGGLYEVTLEGGLTSYPCEYKVEYKLHSEGSYTELGTYTATAASRSAVRRVIRKDGLTPGQYDIKVTKLTGDSTTVIQTDLTWVEVDEIKTDDFSYPNTALMAIEAMATEQLSGAMPNFTALVKGRKVSIPRVMDGAVEMDWEDYYWDPATSEYKKFSDDSVLSWDGSTYVEKWSANPIWCMKDLLTNTRYGLGEYIDTSLMHNATLLEMSRYCEEKVDDGDGGYEKRFRLDIVIDGTGSALDVVSQICTTFNGLPFFSGGTIRLKIDKPESPTQLFTMGNIVPSSFTQTWKSTKEVPNLVEIQYLDKDKDYRQEQIGYVDEDALANGDPLRKQSMKVFTTRQSQAIRTARYALKLAKYANKTVSFKAGIDAITCQAGDVISVAHDVPQWGYSGTVSTGPLASTTTVYLDQEVTIEAAKSYKLMVRLSNDTIEECDVTNSPGTTNVITVSGGFPSAPAAFDKYSFGETNMLKEDFRIVQMTRDSKFEVEIIALEYNANIYDDSAITLPTDNHSSLNYTTPLVSDLRLTEQVLTHLDGTVEQAIDVWFTKPNMTDYDIGNRYRGANIYFRDSESSGWTFAGYSEGNHFQIRGNLEAERTYYVAVTSVPYSGNETQMSTAPTDSITLTGKTTGPATVSNFEFSFTDQLTFTWDKNAEQDILGYEIRDEDANWGTDNSNMIYRGQTNSFAYYPTSREPGTFYIKAISTSGVYSTEAASVIPTNDAPESPTGLASTVFFNIAQFEWGNVADADIQYYEIYRSETNEWTGEETLEGQVSGHSFIVEARKPSDGVTDSATSNTITDGDLAGEGADFCVGDIIKMTSGDNQDETKTITAFNNSTGQITVDSSWTITPSANDRFVIYDKSYFKVRGVDRFGVGTFSLSHAITFETITEEMLGDYVITARKVTTGELITLAAQIKDATITNAKIVELNASKIKAGIIGAEEIIMGAGAIIKSSNYVYETSGYKLDATNGLEVWSGKIQGNVLELGTVSKSRFDSTTQQFLVPTGGSIDFYGASLPAGFLWMDGKAYSRTTYSDLYTAIGNVHLADSELTTRTNDTSGVITMVGGNRTIATNDTLTLIWDGGSQDVTVTGVSGSAITFGSGSGDNLPALNTDIKVQFSATRFFVPDARERVPIGASSMGGGDAASRISDVTLGSLGDFVDGFHTLTEDEMPSHNHVLQAKTASGSQTDAYLDDAYPPMHAADPPADHQWGADDTISDTGGDDEFQHTPTGLICNRIIKT